MVLVSLGGGRCSKNSGGVNVKPLRLTEEILQLFKDTLFPPPRPRNLILMLNMDSGAKC